MKIGIQSKFAKYLPTWEERFARLKALGFQAVDHSLADISQPYYQDDAAMELHCQEVRAAAERHGITFSQAHGPWPTDDTTPEGRAIGWACTHRAVYACYLLGCKHLVIHPQMPYGKNGTELDADYAEALTVELMKELMPDCEKYGVILCLENMPFSKQRISPMKYIVEAVKKVDSPFAGICFDVGHCYRLQDDIAENIRLAAPYLKTLHIHDNRGVRDDHMIPMLGLIDWTVFARALAQSGFDGALSLEVLASDGARMSPSVRNAYEKLAVESAIQLRQMVEEFQQKQ